MRKILAKGVPASLGIVTGKIIIVIDPFKFDTSCLLPSESYIMVTKYTNPDFEIIMSRCHGFIGEKGGITNHLSIVARELGRPAIVGVEHATEIFKDGMRVELNATTGEILAA